MRGEMTNPSPPLPSSPRRGERGGTSHIIRPGSPPPRRGRGWGRRLASASALVSLLLVVLATACVLAGPVSADKDDEGFTSLFNGKDLSGWKT